MSDNLRDDIEPIDVTIAVVNVLFRKDPTPSEWSAVNRVVRDSTLPNLREELKKIK